MDLGYKAYEITVALDISCMLATRLQKTSLKNSLYVCISNKPLRQTSRS